MPNQNILRNLFLYDHISGKLIRRTNNREAGWSRTDGYRGVKISGTNFLSHRVIWTLVYGSIPADKQIDHINGDTSDNRLKNLRLVSSSVNCQNKVLQKNNKSGRVGVCYQPARRKWSAQIKVNQKQKHLGYFDNYHEAVNARAQAEEKFSFTKRHGKRKATVVA